MRVIEDTRRTLGDFGGDTDASVEGGAATRTASPAMMISEPR